MAQCIILTQKAEVRQARITYEPSGLTLAAVKTYLKKKENPEVLGTYKYKNLILSLIGYLKGKAGSENKHELPPPLDSSLYFGDIVLIASQTPNTYVKPVTFKSEDYEAFYTKVFGGFEDIDSDDEEEEEEVVEEEVTEVVEEEVAEVEAEEEEEDESEDEEEGEADDVDIVEFEAIGQEEEVPVQRVSLKATKKKKAPISLLVSQVGTSQILHCPKNEHLQPDADPDVIWRKKSRKLIDEVFRGNSIVDIQVPELEQKIFEASLKEASMRHVTSHWKNNLFQHLYETRVRHILGNLIPDSYVENSGLIATIRDGSLSLEELCNLSTYTLHNDRWKDYIHRRAQREKRQLEGNKSMATDQFLCTRCHKRECTYYEMQTRSADEPMTIFITCINCGKHWRQ